MKYSLRLYVTGRTNPSLRAIRNLEEICRDVLADQYELEVIDVLEHPQLAEDEKILATPTLIRDLPPPLRKIIGDLSRKDQVLLGLDLVPRRESTETRRESTKAPKERTKARREPTPRKERTKARKERTKKD